jgi:hypothetical protein
MKANRELLRKFGTLLCLALLTNSMAYGVPPTAREVLSQINARGPRAVLDDLWGRPGWDDLLTKVETGQEGWLKVATAIRPATDAGASEMLTLAVAAALYRNPRSTLKLGAPAFGVEAICGALDDEWETKQSAIAHLNGRIGAVNTISDQDITAIRDECLKHLLHAKQYVLSTEAYP